MREAKNPDTGNYRTFNEFFVRPLRKGLRPLNTDPYVLVMPADGIISQFGHVAEDKILQAKKHDYSLEGLLAGNRLMAQFFHNGSFVTIYLAPQNYHRVHMPCDGILREIMYVPGRLFSVNYLNIQNIPDLFVRNERVICLFDTEFGPMAQILVGATIVGSIETVRVGTLSPPRKGIIKHWTWPSRQKDDSVSLVKGEEMGRFNLGSTVITLFSPGKVKLLESLKIFSVTKIGQALALGTETCVIPDKDFTLMPEENRKAEIDLDLLLDKH